MDIVVYKNWTDFKTEVTNRSMRPQWFEKVKGNPNPNEYRIYGQDGFFVFETYLKQDDGGDVVDFEANYKDIWNTQLEFKDNTGLTQILASPPTPKHHYIFFRQGRWLTGRKW